LVQCLVPNLAQERGLGTATEIETGGLEHAKINRFNRCRDATVPACGYCRAW
jgi:hypothetical protein